MTQPNQGNTIVYQCQHDMAEQIRAHRQGIYDALQHCSNRPIRVQTIDGATYDGYVSEVKNGCLYLMTAQPTYDSRAFNPFFPQSYYYNNVILPLVLYELLVISLL